MILKQTRMENLLITLGVLKLILVFTFFASFSVIDPRTANAQADSCSGTNLLTQLENEDPLAYRNVKAQADVVINSKSVFWKIEKDGVAPSYLFGTMHLSDPRISTLTDDVKSALAQSDTVVVESVDALDPQKAQQAMGKLAHLTFLTQGTLRDLVDDELEDELKSTVEERGIPMNLADRMQPWVVATTISLPVCEIQRKQSGELVLDSVLAQHAEDNGLALKGLETIEEQLTVLATLPESYHVSALEETLASGSLANDMIHTMKDIYKQGNIGIIFPLMKAVMPKTGSGEGAAQFQEALIEKRNLTMAERVEPMLENGKVFVAVGALHLPDETGLVKLLRDRGYKVTSLR
ncbi:MAG: TraB/GumN family protein [Rhizobiaceae bacterium]|nr:TraB/GumN family protein [Rhizobiaceae bacterium]